MRDFSIIIATLAIMAVACSPKDENSTKDTDQASVTDVQQAGDSTELSDAVTLTDAEKKDSCYSNCLGTDMSKEDCKKACDGKWAKDAGSSSDTSMDAETSLPDDVSATKG